MEEKKSDPFGKITVIKTNYSQNRPYIDDIAQPFRGNTDTFTNKLPMEWLKKIRKKLHLDHQINEVCPC